MKSAGEICLSSLREGLKIFGNVSDRFSDPLSRFSNRFSYRFKRFLGAVSFCRCAALAAQCEIPPPYRKHLFEIVSQRGVSHPFALFSRGIAQVSLRYPLCGGGRGYRTSTSHALQWGVNFCREAARCLAGPSGRLPTLRCAQSLVSLTSHVRRQNVGQPESL